MAAGSISHNVDRFQQWRDSLLLREFLNVRPIKHRKPAQPKPATHEITPVTGDDIEAALDYLGEVAARSYPTSDVFRFCVYMLSMGLACDDERNSAFMRRIGLDPEELDLLKAVAALRKAGA